MTENTAILNEWRPVLGYEGLYEVSAAGQVRRVGRAARTGVGRGGGARIGRILKDQPYRNGYRTAQLWKQGQCYAFGVHQLVAGAFIGPCPAGQEVNHKDGVKSNNSSDNLEYVTRSGNMEHAYAIGLRSPKIHQMVVARRKPRLTVTCDCGCGAQLETPDPKGRPRRFVSGHNMRMAS